ncbi:hypothetical protein LEP1GSC202_0665 [Leptospira yanagawae serovar Saopaulo str. Sao Paulo = ATCC 700523]|uniref:Uncharacterized protein n=1 Tax=Leptospira yanagawae serovar Saopaulo str. Sao Paulo = ATCC 700523 TaxID=1249483 RepID=A0A5E8HHH2_9LEPT|nr:hypothetical protein LEP1GSC202_0665 [Leptospira yanagawae serovar Saopaulo str. Sao Paulo = ATCC 700523]
MDNTNVEGECSQGSEFKDQGIRFRTIFLSNFMILDKMDV